TVCSSHDPAPPELSTLSLHDALPILALVDAGLDRQDAYRLVQKYAYVAWDGGTPLREALEADPVASSKLDAADFDRLFDPAGQRSEEHTSELQSRENLVCRLLLEKKK